MGMMINRRRAYGGKKGLLPSGYKQLEYIKSTGAQYIDTGIKGNQDTKVEIKWQYHAASTNTGSGRIFGSRRSIGSNTFVVGSDTGTAESRGFYFFEFDNQYYFVTNKGLYIGTWTTIVHDRLTHIINGVNYTRDYNIQNFETPQNLKIFGFDNIGTVSAGMGVGMCAYCKIWSSEMLMRYFIPCKRNSDNAVGMYDLVNNTFYANAGTGTFIAGPDK